MAEANTIRNTKMWFHRDMNVSLTNVPITPDDRLHVAGAANRFEAQDPRICSILFQDDIGMVNNAGYVKPAAGSVLPVDAFEARLIASGDGHTLKFIGVEDSQSEQKYCASKGASCDPMCKTTKHCDNCGAPQLYKCKKTTA